MDDSDRFRHRYTYKRALEAGAIYLSAIEPQNQPSASWAPTVNQLRLNHAGLIGVQGPRSRAKKGGHLTPANDERWTDEPTNPSTTLHAVVDRTACAAQAAPVSGSPCRPSGAIFRRA